MAGHIPAELREALEAARRLYSSFPNVTGSAAGLKRRRGRRAGGPAIIFFVRRKVSRPRRRLPRSVFGRDSRGRILRSIRFPTDVIEVGSPAFACGAGGRIRAFGERGSISMLFRDKDPGGAGAHYLITCAHVAGDLERSPPVSPELRLEGGGAGPFARVMKNTVARRGIVEYDAALARISRESLPVSDLSIEGGGRIRGWLDAGDLRLGMELEVSAPSGRRRGTVDSLAGELLVRLDGRLYRVRNLLGLRIPVCDGDSGGLVHDRGLAAGMVVARSYRGYTWWQPLGPALDLLNRLRPRTAVSPF